MKYLFVILLSLVLFSCVDSRVANNEVGMGRCASLVAKVKIQSSALGDNKSLGTGCVYSLHTLTLNLNPGKIVESLEPLWGRAFKAFKKDPLLGVIVLGAAVILGAFYVFFKIIQDRKSKDDNIVKSTP